MRDMEEQLFAYLSDQILTGNQQIENYVNKDDDKIYLAKSRNDDTYFIVKGELKLDTKGAINESKSSIILYGRNAKTQEVEALSPSNIKKVEVVIPLREFTEEFEGILQEISGEERTKEYKAIREDYFKLLALSEEIIQGNAKDAKEDIFSYAKRVGSPGNYRMQQMAKAILKSREVIKKLLFKAYSDPEMGKEYEKAIERIVTGIVRYMQSVR